MIVEMNQSLPNRIRCPLIPFGPPTRFLSGHNLDKSAWNKVVKTVALLDVTMERGTQVLGQKENTFDP